MHLPSAGMIRFRFNGSACASQPFRAPRGVGEHSAADPARKSRYPAARREAMESSPASNAVFEAS
jgi:hypothetical protein